MPIKFDRVKLEGEVQLSVCVLCRAVVLPTKDDEVRHAESHGGTPADQEVEGVVRVHGHASDVVVRKGDWTEREIRTRMRIVDLMRKYDANNPMMVEGLKLALDSLDAGRSVPVEETMAWMMAKGYVIEHDAHGLSWEPASGPERTWDDAQYRETKRALG